MGGASDEAGGPSRKGVSRGAPRCAASANARLEQGYQSTMVAWANERPWVTPKSAHFTVGRTGDVIQHVGIYDPAWAAGRVADPTWRLLPADASTADSTPNKLCVHIEHEGFSVPPQYGYDYLYDETHAWPQPMVQSSIEVQRWCLGELGVDASADAVIGHFMTDGVSRADVPAQAVPLLLPVARVLLVYDRDEAGERAVKRLSEQYGTMRSVAIPNANDITDYHLSGGSLRDLVQPHLYVAADACLYCGGERYSYRADGHPVCRSHADAEREASERSPLVRVAIEEHWARLAAP